MKILLLGKNGQVGWELQRALGRWANWSPWTTTAPSCVVTSPTCPALAMTPSAPSSPDVIVNAAAHTAVDKAESEPDLARSINALAPRSAGQRPPNWVRWLVHYSTDYVFDGSGNTPWVRPTPPEPVSVYGRTKLEGEQRIQQSGCKHLILRTSWVYAARGGNFAKTMLRLAQEREHLTVIDDQWGAPTGADLLADITAHAIRQVRPQEDGRRNNCPGASTTWWQRARPAGTTTPDIVIAQAALAQPAIEINAGCNIQPVAHQRIPDAGQTPANSRLDTAKLPQRTFGLTLPPWQEGVKRMLVLLQDT